MKKTVTEIDPATIRRLMNDVFKAHQEAASHGYQEALQRALVEVGLLPETLASGEAGIVFTVLGALCGSIMDARADVATTQAIMMGDRSRVAHLAASPSRLEQLASFLSFMDGQLRRICQPDTDRAVLAVLVAVFCKMLDGSAALLPS